MPGGGDRGDSVRDEFLAEAQEIIEALSRDLLLLDHGHKSGNSDPELLNEVFRGVHTLKGIAGMFGYAKMGALAHALEDLLDDLRLGRVSLSAATLDVLFEGVEDFQRLLGEAKDPRNEINVDFEQYAQSIERLAMPEPLPEVDSLEEYDIDPGILSVLTEYEEHRLRTNVEQGMVLYRLRVRFSLASIDSALEDLKTRAKPLGEIITYLPSVGGGDGDTIDLDVLIASRASLPEVQEALGGSNSLIEPVVRRHVERTVPPVSTPRPQREAHQERDEGTAVSVMPHASAPSISTRDIGADALSLRSVANTVRVDIQKLDHLMNVVGELAIVRSAVARMNEKLRGRPELRQLAFELHRIHRGFERHLEELQDGILDVRMVPLGHVFDKLARVVRQVAREHEKEVRLIVTGSDTELDKLIVEELSDPLMHIIRNAIDHGIESATVRELAGKPTLGTLTINAYQKGNHVVIEVADDGAGIDEERLVDHAIGRALITEEAAHELSRDEVLNLIFLPGLSTREVVSDLSGRGVGMDVVKTNIGRLGGVIDVHSDWGAGTKFLITLPITLAIVSALVVRVEGRTYAIPLASVQEALKLEKRSVRTVEGREVLTLRGSTLPICRLGTLFGHSIQDSKVGNHYVVVAGFGNRRLGFVVDALEGQQDVVIKPLGPSLRDVKGFAGATDLGDQRVVLILDAPALLEEMMSGGERSAVGAA